MPIDCREIETGTPLHAQQQALREDVLRRPLGRVLTEAERGADIDGVHFAAVEEGTVVASLILFPHASGVVRLRQMAVASHLQGQGVGARLLAFAEDHARERGIHMVRLHARGTATGFYERAGYAAEGGTFDEDGVPHVLMMKSL